MVLGNQRSYLCITVGNTRINSRKTARLFIPHSWEFSAYKQSIVSQTLLMGASLRKPGVETLVYQLTHWQDPQSS